MTRTQVCMDNCGIKTIIQGTLFDGKTIGLEIESDCASVQKLAQQLKEIDLYQSIQGMENSVIYRAATKCPGHAACLVPGAIIRTMEVEAGIALPGESFVSTEKV